MDKLKGNITISKRTSNIQGSYMAITISDRLSGDRIIGCELSLTDFAEVLTGLAFVECGFKLHDVKNVGNKRMIKSACCERVLNKERQKELVAYDAKEYLSEGWSVHSDGTTTQQNGKLHRYTLIKYVEELESLEK